MWYDLLDLMTSPVAAPLLPHDNNATSPFNVPGDGQAPSSILHPHNFPQFRRQRWPYPTTPRCQPLRCIQSTRWSSLIFAGRLLGKCRGGRRKLCWKTAEHRGWECRCSPCPLAWLGLQFATIPVYLGGPGA